MKKLFTLIAALLFAATVWAQEAGPQKTMSYQAVIRNDANELVTNANNITVVITIRQADTIAYRETHNNVKTNQNGLASLLIGTGNVSNGSMNDVDWTKAKIRTKISVPGNGDVTATAPVTAVPLSMYAYDVDSSSTIIKNIKKEFKDTLSNYFDTAQINNTFKYYLTIDGLCDSIEKCEAINHNYS